MGGNNTLGRAPRPEYNDQGISTAIYMQLIIRLCNKHRKRKEKKSIVLYTLHICTICYVCFVMIVVGSCDLVIPVFRVSFIGTSIRESLYIYHKNKTFSRPSYLHNKNPYTWKMGIYTKMGPRDFSSICHSIAWTKSPRLPTQTWRHCSPAVRINIMYKRNGVLYSGNIYTGKIWSLYC